MNTKTQNLVAKSTSEGWTRASEFIGLLHTVINISSKDLGTVSQARSFISANKHHNTIDNIISGISKEPDNPHQYTPQLEPLLTSYQQFLLGKVQRRRPWQHRQTGRQTLASGKRTWTKKTIGSLTTKPTTTNVCPYTIKALQDLQTFQNKHKLTPKDITHLAQTLQDLQIPRFADPSTTTRPPK